ncbi:hypothetical protein [Pseudogracilibacillus sp. SO30301A]|uniref:hypothetical protein n=1 Tax=Pseudogracilibacillus sp. SO30301A TaxID=3098291 RepID=UPI00300DE5A4
MKEKSVAFPDELMENMKLETVIFSPVSTEIGVAALSESSQSIHILRLYKLIFEEYENTYKPVQELEAFSFQHYDELTDFLEKLPEMSALEMLLVLNQDYTKDQFIN